MSTRRVPKNVVERSVWWDDKTEEALAAARYAHTIGLDLSPEERLARARRDSVGAPVRFRPQPGEPVGSPHVERDVRDVLSSRWGMLA